MKSRFGENGRCLPERHRRPSTTQCEVRKNSRTYTETVSVKLTVRSGHEIVLIRKTQRIVVSSDQGRCVLLGVIVVGVVGGALLTTGCERRTGSGPSGPGSATDGPSPTHVSWEAEFEMSKRGRPRAVLHARRMEQYETEDSTYSVWRAMDDSARVQVFLFDEEGDSSATVTADSLVFQNQKGVLDAYRDVVVTTEDNKRLESEKLRWHQADRTIRTHRFVRIRTPSEVVQGNGLVADENLETYQIGRFSAEVDVEEGEE